MLDRLCEKYGQRPSDVLGIENPKDKLDFDMALVFQAGYLKKQEEDKIKGKGETLPNETDSQRVQRIRNQFAVVQGVKKV